MLKFADDTKIFDPVSNHDDYHVPREFKQFNFSDSRCWQMLQTSEGLIKLTVTVSVACLLWKLLKRSPRWDYF